MTAPTKAQLEAEWVQLCAMTEAAKTAIAQRALLLDLCERCLRALDEDEFPRPARRTAAGDRRYTGVNMSKLEQAARQLLEAVEDFQGYRQDIDTAIADLHEALEAAPEPAAVGQEPVALGPLAKRRVFDYIRGAYDLGYNDARNARAVPGDNAPGYKGRDVEVDHGGALFNALRACITAPQPARQPLTDKQIDEALVRVNYCALTPKGIQHAIARAVERAHGIGGADART